VLYKKGSAGTFPASFPAQFYFTFAQHGHHRSRYGTQISFVMSWPIYNRMVLRQRAEEFFLIHYLQLAGECQGKVNTKITGMDQEPNFVNWSK
jgi:hypothetical protein